MIEMLFAPAQPQTVYATSTQPRQAISSSPSPNPSLRCQPKPAAASQSASQSASQPASQPARQPACQPASPPASPLGSRPASQPASQPAGQPASPSKAPWQGRKQPCQGTLPRQETALPRLYFGRLGKPCQGSLMWQFAIEGNLAKVCRRVQRGTLPRCLAKAGCKPCQGWLQG